MQRVEEGEVDEWLEHVIENEFVEELEDAGWITLKGDKVRRGFADRFCFGAGARTVIIEFKRTGAPKKRRGEKLQNHYRNQFAALGFDCRKVTGMNEACDLLLEMCDGN